MLTLDNDFPYRPTQVSLATDATVIQIDVDPVKERIPLWTFPIDVPVRADSARALSLIADGAAELLDDTARQRIEARRDELTVRHGRLRAEGHEAALAEGGDTADDRGMAELLPEAAGG